MGKAEKKEHVVKKVPLCQKMERTIKSLGVGMFVVKQDKSNYNVCFKRVIIVGGLFDKTLAENIAKKYNNITDVIKEKLLLSMEKVNRQTKDMYDEICNDLNTDVQNSTSSIGGKQTEEV